MKRLLPLVIIISLLTSACSSTKDVVGKEEAPASVKVDGLSLNDIAEIIPLSETKELITTLASDEFEGRGPGTEGYNKAAEYVENYLKKNGIQPFFDDSYKHHITISGRKSHNVVGLIGEKTSGDYILVGAHLDHLPPSSSGTDKIFNGANDNASGVVAAIQVAKVLAKGGVKKPVIVALFSEEENGLKGSKELAKFFKEEGVNISEVYNFEMIGAELSAGPNQVYITGYNKSNLAEEMNRIIGRKFVTFLPAEVTYQLFSRSDNFPFYAEYKIPAHTISTFDFQNYNHYHKVSDDVKNLGYGVDNMNEIIKTSAFIISTIINGGTKIELNGN